MENKLYISPSPHIHGDFTTRRLMRDVIIALLPALAISVWVYGISVLVVTGVSIACCILFEMLIQRYLLHGPNTVQNLSAVVTGLLLAFNVPSNLPLPLVVLGALVAIGVGKMSFGGLGRNPFNPALVGRVFLLISFPVYMTTFPVPETADAFSGATPLAFVREALKNGESVSAIMQRVSYTDIITGFKGGSLGEIAGGALILGFIYLLWRRVITWHIPVVILATITLIAGALHLSNPEAYMNPQFHLFTGGVLLGAIYMATDYVTSPMTKTGMVIYAIGIGFITIMIRTFGAYPEGISFAILIMNATVPLINKYIKPRPFGRIVKKA